MSQHEKRRKHEDENISMCLVCQYPIDKCICCPECGHACLLERGYDYCPVCGPGYLRTEE